MIQDIGTKKLDNQYRPNAVPDADSYIFFIDRNKVATAAGDSAEFILPRFCECDQTAHYTYLFAIDEETFFLADRETALPEPYSYEEIRFLRDNKTGPRHRIFAAYTALHLSHWYNANRFCGACGCATEHDSVERALRCPSCGNLIFPRLVPAVIVGVTNGDRILLTRYNRGRGVSVYALIAGFTEIGETFEQNVAREVMEEVGLKVKNIRYYKSQPWGIVDDILAGFYCDVDGDDTIRLDTNELREGIWVKREDVELQPNDFSLTNEMMKRFKDGLENVPLD